MVQKYVIAVSGGVDSVVLLHMMVQKIDNNDIIVAHFDHGIRVDSAADAIFVKSLAEKYGLKFEVKRENLGAGISEEKARQRRYLFLKSAARKYNAILTTAHHADDVVETVAINLTRGTGWRGLAVLNSKDIYRPLISLTKIEIKAYAQKNNLSWHEDSTNKNTKYLRNYFREKLLKYSDDSKRQILALRSEQIYLEKSIDDEVNKIIDSFDFKKIPRYFFININDAAAMEILRKLTKCLLTRPQLKRLLIAIKTAESNKKYFPGAKITVLFSARYFNIQVLK
jgi:tRNA(Ile)-lysidine synthetase-like protein